MLFSREGGRWGEREAAALPELRQSIKKKGSKLGKCCKVREKGSRGGGAQTHLHLLRHCTLFRKMFLQFPLKWMGRGSPHSGKPSKSRLCSLGDPAAPSARAGFCRSCCWLEVIFILCKAPEILMIAQRIKVGGSR